MMGVNSLPKTVTRQRRGCNLNTGPSAPESSTLTTRLPSHHEVLLFAYGPADVTAIPKPHHLLPHLNPDWFYLSGTGLPRLSWKRGH